jgi:hypothetical protein
MLRCLFASSLLTVAASGPACGLSPGDLALVSLRTSASAGTGGKAFEVLVLAPRLPAGCSFSVTDQGVMADGALRSGGEGGVTFTVGAGSAGIAAGSTIVWQEEGGAEGAGGAGAGGGTWRMGGSFAMSMSGEQLLVYDGDAGDISSGSGAAAAGAVGVVAGVFQLSYKGAFDATATSSTTSALAPGLAGGGGGGGRAYVALPRQRNYRYVGGRRGGAAELLAGVTQAGLWSGTDAIEAGPLLSTGPFAVEAPGTALSGAAAPTAAPTPTPPAPAPSPAPSPSAQLPAGATAGLPASDVLGSAESYYAAGSIDFGAPLRVAAASAAAGASAAATEAAAGASVAALRAALAALLRFTHRRVSYDDARDALQLADAANATHIRLLYTGEAIPRAWDGGKSWNREHLFPQSFMGDHKGPDHSDLHALRAADPGVNSARGNKVRACARAHACASRSRCHTVAGTLFARGTRARAPNLLPPRTLPPRCPPLIVVRRVQ